MRLLFPPDPEDEDVGEGCLVWLLLAVVAMGIGFFLLMLTMAIKSAADFFSDLKW